MSERPSPTICVLGLTPVLTVTAEAGTSERDADIHIHPGGQGFWIARMAVELGERVVLCTPVGGESGDVYEALVRGHGLELDAVEIEGHTAAYVHDRRSGERREVAHSGYPVLNRHELDSLYGRAVARSLEAGLCVLAGYPEESAVPADMYRRLAHDLATHEVTVVADLRRRALAAVLEGGGVDLLKISDEELVEDGHAASDSTRDLAAAAEELTRDGIRGVVVTRAEKPLLAWIGGESYVVESPALEVVDHRGAGDATTAALAVGRRRALDVEALLRLAAAAGAATVARHGLASAELQAIDRLAERVTVNRRDA